MGFLGSGEDMRLWKTCWLVGSSASFDERLWQYSEHIHTHTHMAMMSLHRQLYKEGVSEPNCLDTQAVS